MKRDDLIPIVIGVTGHRQIDKDDSEKIYASVLAELKKIKDGYPSTPVRMLCSLAAGGDTICCRAAIELGIPVTAVLPFDVEEFRKDFEGQEREMFEELFSRCEGYFVNESTEKDDGTPDRDFFYRQNSIYMAIHSHILLALWDGAEATKNGCGTASAVEFALKGTYIPQRGTALRSSDNSEVIHVYTPRNGLKLKEAGEVSYLGNVDYINGVLAKTESFNSIKTENTDDGGMLGGIYHKADKISIVNADRYKKILFTLAAAGSSVALFFLLYDEANLHMLLLVCGLIIILEDVWMKSLKNRDCHMTYVEMRALAEVMRVREYLRYAGSRIPVSYLMSYAQRRDQGWIMLCSDTLDTESRTYEKMDPRKYWIEDQLNYHIRARMKTAKKSEFSSNVVKFVKVLTAVFYFAGLIYEIMALTGIVTDNEIIRTVLKIVIGTISVFVIFVSEYYEKLAVSRECDDHETMAAFYNHALSQLNIYGSSEELLILLASEELSENASWYSYKKESRPSIEL